MRYGYVENLNMGAVNSYATALLISMRDQFASIPGWEVFDDKTAHATVLSRFVVWKVTTSEGPSNAVYVRINIQGTDHFGVETWEGWNSATSVGTGASIGRGRFDHPNAIVETTSWVWAGDQDHVVFAILGTHCYAPTYLGLTTKLRPATDGPKGWVMCTWYYVTSHSTTDQDGVSYSDDGKAPVLRGANGVANRRSRLFRLNPQFENYNLDGGLEGPYTTSQIPGKRRMAMYFYPIMLFEGWLGTADGSYGPRGILKSVLVLSDAYWAKFYTGQRMKVGSRDYMLIRTTLGGNDTYTRRNSWGNWFGAGDWEMAWAIPTSDYYVPCFIEGSE